MAQPQTNAYMEMLDPFGFWKTARDTSLESLGKLMIDMVNSDEYARFTGQFLDQYMSVLQPVQDNVQKGMTLMLPFFNLPARAEVISIAQQLVNIEKRLDDLDNQTFEAGEDYRKEMHSVDRRLDQVLTKVMARLDDLEAQISPARETAATKPEPKAEAKK